MKTVLLASCLFISATIFAQTPCNNGMAGEYPCGGYNLMSEVTLGDMNSSGANDSWGWTDSLDGQEYAIICLEEGTAFVNITDPVNPIYLGKLLGEGAPSVWRDAKTYNDHVFIVSESPGHGMQVFDLTKLRGVTSPQTFVRDAYYTGFGNAHNIVINEDSGYAYAVGTDTYSGGPHFVNIQNPTQPSGASGYAGGGYSHDAQVVTYNGPDTQYVGKEIYIGSNETEVVIVDVTNKSNPIPIDTFGYFNTAYTHQAWLTEDHEFLLLCDEIDELDFGFNSRTVVFNMTDLDNGTLNFTYSGPTPATDHNGYVVGDSYYLANYTAGLREVDLSQVSNFSMSEIGFFDTHPSNDTAGFAGAWNVYPYFPSRNILISDRSRGMILVKSTNDLGIDDVEVDSEVSLAPNPGSEIITIKRSSSAINTVSIADALGKIVYTENVPSSNEVQINVSTLQNGIYFVSVNEGEGNAHKFIKQ